MTIIVRESLSEKMSGMSMMRNCSINLPSCWEYVKYVIIVAILLLIRSILTQMMGVGKLLWETLLLPCHGKKIGMVPRWTVWVGVFRCRHHILSYPRTYKQWSKVLKDVMRLWETCVLSIILPPILRQQTCAVAMQKKMSLRQSKMDYAQELAWSMRKT